MSLALTIYCDLCPTDADSRHLAQQAIETFNQENDPEDQITPPEDAGSILGTACELENLREYVNCTGDGLDDCNVDPEEYLAWIIEEKRET